MRSRKVLFAGAIALSALASSEERALAFCRTTTSPVPADFQPSPNACWTHGLPLWWRNECVGYSLQKDASRQISYDDASNAITIAFSKWTSTACPTDGSGNSRASIDVRDEGSVACSLVQYNSDQPNQHVIVFRDDNWPHNDANNTLALTTVVFNPDTGEIYDADMEINTAQQKMTLTDPVPADGYDFLSIVTHETGHFLGLAHSGDMHATMFAHYNQGSTAMRQLTSDDVSGICAIYPPDGTRAVSTSVTAAGKVTADACDPTPRHGFGTDCGQPPKKTTCAVAARGVGMTRSDDVAFLTPAAAVALTFVARRIARRLRARTKPVTT
jgi:hypothetical protein